MIKTVFLVVKHCFLLLRTKNVIFLENIFSGFLLFLFVFFYGCFKK